MANEKPVEIQVAFPEQLRGKRVTVLGIADRYACMDPALIRLLRERVGRLVPEARPT